MLLTINSVDWIRCTLLAPLFLLLYVCLFEWLVYRKYDVLVMHLQFGLTVEKIPANKKKVGGSFVLDNISRALLFIYTSIYNKTGKHVLFEGATAI